LDLCTQYTVNCTVLTSGTLFRYEGVLEGLYKGLSMNMIKGPVAAGIWKQNCIFAG